MAQVKRRWRTAFFRPRANSYTATQVSVRIRIRCFPDRLKGRNFPFKRQRQEKFALFTKLLPFSFLCLFVALLLEHFPLSLWGVLIKFFIHYNLTVHNTTQFSWFPNIYDMNNLTCVYFLSSLLLDFYYLKHIIQFHSNGLLLFS